MADKYTGPAAQWVTSNDTGKYVGVPDAYRVQQGEIPGGWDEMRQKTAPVRPAASTPIYGVPHYTYSDINSLYGKGPEQVFNLQYKLYALGYLPTFRPGFMDGKTEEAAKKAFEFANKNGITLEQALANRSTAPGFDKKGGVPGGGSGSGGVSSSTTTQVQKSINLTSREAAMQILSNALAQELGRQPSQDELTRFTTSLNRAEKANPTVTTSTQSTSSRTAGSHTSTSVSGTSTTKQGNVDPQYQATEFAKSKPLAAERNRFQDSQYFNVIAQMIGAQ